MTLTEAEVIAANQRICSILRVTPSLHNDDLQGIVHDLDAITSLALRAAHKPINCELDTIMNGTKWLDDK